MPTWIGELETLIAAHPLRERLRGQLMLALYRSGRQAEALHVYRAARQELADELGLEPGEALRRLEQAILQQDPELELRRGVRAGRRRRPTGRCSSTRAGRRALDGAAPRSPRRLPTPSRRAS